MTPSPTLILSVFPGFGIGGAQVRYAAIANRFGPRFRHAIIALDGRTDCAERLAPGLDLSFPTVAVEKGAMLANRAAFRRLLRALRPDVLVTHNWGSIEWALANLPPLVRHVHIEDGFGPEERERQLPRRAWTRRLVLRRATVVLPSRTLERIATGIWRLPAVRVRYQPNGIDLARFAPARTAVREGPPVIGTVAALRAEKNLGRLIEAVAALPPELPAQLVIVGDGPERPALEARAAALGVGGRVRFAGYAADPAPFYAGFDLFALSSDTEQMPISVLEAMAAGLPLAATDVGDVRDMLSAENAPHVVARDVAALGGALVALLRAGPAVRAAIGAANRAKAERDYDQEAMFQAYAALFEAPRPGG